MPYAVNLVLVAHFLLVLTFDHLLEDVRLAAAGVITLSYALLAGRALLKNDVHSGWILTGVLSIILAWILGHASVYGATPATGGDYLRVIAPFLSAAAVISYYDRISYTMLLRLSAITIFVALYFSLIYPPIMVGGTERFHPFTAGLHTSAYIVATVLLLSVESWRAKLVSNVFALFIITVAVVLLWGYGVRTSILLVMIYLFSILILQVLVRGNTRFLVYGMWASIFILLPTLLLFFLATTDWGALDEFASGRIGNYIERIGILGERSFGEILLGTGVGSDHIIVSAWWWEEKDSHSDVLTLLWEGGVMAIIGLILVIVGLFRLGGAALLPGVTALVVSSTVSNALLSRPNVAFLYFSVLACCLLAIKYGEAGLKFNAINKKCVNAYHSERSSSGE